MFIKRRPELFHHAIAENYSQLITSFAPVAGTELLQQKNELGETPLLHGVRLNRAAFIQALLKRPNTDELLDELNQHAENIFHILARNSDASETLELIIDHLVKRSIDIGERFDHVDSGQQTPLQVAICSQNLRATRLLWNYSSKEVLQKQGENLIHFTVRHGDLLTLKYLLEEEGLMEQGNRTSLTMTPFELAKSLERADMVEYLGGIYPQPEIEFEGEDSNDDQ